jgi:CheY-like chemotaxis protein
VNRLAKWSLLVVDSDSSARKLTSLVLTLEGASVEAVETGAAALEALARTPTTALVVVEERLTGMTGLELLREIRRRPEIRDVAVIVVTTGNGKGAAMEYMTLGCRAYLTKPLDPERLVGEIVRALEATS